MRRWNQNTPRYIIAAAVPLMATAIILFREELVSIKRYFPECVFRKTTGYLCPACGNTRCVECLFHGEVWRAIQYNVTIPILLSVVMLLYLENLLVIICGRNIKIVPKNTVFWWGIGTMIFAYYFLRNLLPLSIA